MALDASQLDAPPAEGIQIGRGGFLRNTKDSPYITDAGGALVKTGERKGQPKRSAYGPPSGYGKQIENTYNLTKWGERQAMLGLGLDGGLAAECAQLVHLDRDSQEFRKAADRIVALAKRAAKSDLAADRGSHAHLLTEDHDEERDWISRAEAGENLGLDRGVQQSLIDAWYAMLERDGLEIVAVEAACVDDEWRLAGTLDRIARCTKPLRFTLVTGEIVTIAAGTVLVLDIKSGKRSTGNDGAVMYWGGYAIQIAGYAKSVPYDLTTETRGVWPWTIDQDHALIAHLDVLGAIDGNPSCELVYVDLSAGREHGGRCVADAKAWEKRKDVFSVGQLADEPPEVSPAPTLTPAEQKAQLTTDPDEGGPADPAAVTILEDRYRSLDQAGNLFIRQLVGDAQRARVPFHLKDNHTLRRFEILRALVTLAAHQTEDDETVRCVLATIIGNTARHPNVTAGHLIGSLGADQAALFAQRADQLTTSTIPATVSPDGVLSLQFA